MPHPYSQSFLFYICILGEGLKTYLKKHWKEEASGDLK